MIRTVLLTMALLLVAVPSMVVAQGSSNLQPQPPSTATGVAHVDAIIAATLASDGSALANMLEFTDRECSPGGGIGLVDCPEGVEAGTPIPSVSVSECQGWATGEVPADFLRDFAGKANVLFFVAHATDREQGDYVIVFGNDASGASARALGVGSSGITSIRFGCADSVGSMLETWGWSSFLLAPRNQPPGPPATGDSVIRLTHEPSPPVSAIFVVAAAVALGVWIIRRGEAGRR